MVLLIRKSVKNKGVWQTQKYAEIPSLQIRIPSELLKTSSRLGGAFVLRISIEDSNEAVVNDSPVDCQSREWPFSAEKVESRRSCFFYATQIIVCGFFYYVKMSDYPENAL